MSTATAVLAQNEVPQWDIDLDLWVVPWTGNACWYQAVFQNFTKDVWLDYDCQLAYPLDFWDRRL